MIESVLAIDPGRAKCGIAVVSRTEGVLARTVVPSADLPNTGRFLASRFKPDAVIIGGGTGAREIASALAGLPVSVHIVDERLSTQKARVRYFADNPPRGWRRLVPRSLLIPPEPYDDYAAILLAEGFLRSQEQDAPEKCV